MRFFRFLSENAPFLTVGVVLTFLSSFGQTFFISIFAGEIRDAFDLSHSAWGSIYASGTLLSAVVMVWSGGLTDHFRVRVLAVVVLIGLSLSCLAMTLLPVVWLLPVVIFALRFFGQGMSSHIATVAMARWFVSTRGRALSIAGLGFSIGEAVLPIVFVALFTVVPWRSLWLAAAVLTLLALPLVIRLLRNERTPQSMAEENPSPGMLNKHWKRGDALRHWLFWAMAPIVLGPSAFGTAFFFQQVHIAEIKNWAHLELVALFPVYTVTGIVAMLVSGWAIDRFGTSVLMAAAQLPVAAGFFIFAMADTLLWGSVGVILMAVSFGANATLPAAFWAEYYGTRFLGSIKALATAMMVLGSAIGPGLSGALIDMGMDFPAQMPWISLWFLAMFCLVSVALIRARRDLPTAKIDVEGT